MNTAQTNKQNMHRTMLAYLNANQSIWQNVSILADEVAIIQSIVNDIEKIDQELKNVDTTALTATKNNVVKDVIIQAAKLGVRATPYARKTGNLILLAKVDYSINSLNKQSYNACLQTCTTMADALKAEGKNVEPYNIKSTDITLLTTLINKAMPSLAAKDVSVTTKAGGISTLFKQFKKLVPVINNLDDLIKGQFSDTDPRFVEEYFIARRINDKRPRGKNAPTDSPATPIV